MYKYSLHCTAEVLAICKDFRISDCVLPSTKETIGWRSSSALISVVRRWSLMKTAQIYVRDSTMETSPQPMCWKATGCSTSTPITLAGSSSCAPENTGGTSSGAVQALASAPCDVSLTSNEDPKYGNPFPNVSIAPCLCHDYVWPTFTSRW